MRKARILPLAILAATGMLDAQRIAALVTPRTRAILACSPNNPDGSLLVQKQKSGHFAQLSDSELQMVIDWIKNGAPQN